MTLFCKDCKYCRPDTSNLARGDPYEYAECAHPSSANHNDLYFVTGKPDQYYCRTVRFPSAPIGNSPFCGPNATYFEPKEPEPKEPEE